jgi:hypothetical protein
MSAEWVVAQNKAGDRIPEEINLRYHGFSSLNQFNIQEYKCVAELI